MLPRLLLGHVGVDDVVIVLLLLGGHIRVDGSEVGLQGQGGRLDGANGTSFSYFSRGAHLRLLGWGWTVVKMLLWCGDCAGGSLLGGFWRWGKG